MNEPDDHEIDITIEAVTGTVYDLCVSLFETILGIKTKIQRLEGIPVYQQHLIYGDIELHDEYCLEEYDIRTGCQLKLVIALRGGPVHAHRIQLEDSALLELAEYLDVQSGEDHDQYMLMLLNDGNFELVNTDGRSSQLQSPVDLSESRLSGSSQTSLLTAAQPRVLTLTENMNTRDKMRDIQTKLKSLRLNRAEHQVPKKSSKLKRKCTAKVIILDSCASSRVHVSPVTPPQPSSRLCTNTPHYCSCTCSCQHHCHHCHDISGKTQRKLIFRPLHDQYITNSNGKLPGETSSNQKPVLPKIAEQQPTSTPQSVPSLHYNPNRRRKLKPISSTTAVVNTTTRVSPSLSIDHKLDPSSSVRMLSGLTTFSRNGSQHRKLQTADSNNNNGHFLPPIVNKRSVIENNASDFLKQDKKNRCMQCGKKTRIAATYTCRCGGLYCGTHRYAETHSCTFDYKTKGKETIARNNPLVVATKLPKI